MRGGRIHRSAQTSPACSYVQFLVAGVEETCFGIFLTLRAFYIKNREGMPRISRRFRVQLRSVPNIP
eukprot:7685407-Pyramimonas_sp.AAC.1